MDKVNFYQHGNTVKLECTFYDFDGQLVDPAAIKVIVYNYKYEVIFEGTGSRISLGKYFYDYKTESIEQRLFYEWYGEIDGLPTLKRGEFVTQFI